MKHASLLRFVLAGALVLLGAPPAAAQDQALALSGFGGFTTDPGGFDVFRQSEFDPGFHVGGSLAFRLAPRLAVRGDFALARSSGRESGAVNEDVQFDRSYYGVALEYRFPIGAFSPYVLGGGGMVAVDRQAPSLTYRFSEMAGRFGAGVAYPIGGTLEAFAEASEWFYARATTGEGLQFDTKISVGMSFLPRL